MYDGYIRLSIQGLTRGKELAEAYILILKAEDETGFVPILIDERGFKLVCNAMQEHDFTCSHMMNLLADRVNIPMTGVRILRPSGGKTMALVDFQMIDQLLSITVPIAEAVVAALEKGLPIWIDRNAFERQAKLNSPSNDSMALPITALSNDLLEKALQGAVDEDNFELATILRDELNRREKSISNNEDDMSPTD